MLRRLFTLMLGLGAGLLVGGWFVRRLEEMKRAVTPSGLAEHAGRTAGALGERLRDVRAHAHEHAALHEAKLRDQFDVPRIEDVRGR